MGGKDVINCYLVQGERVREPPSGCHGLQCYLSFWRLYDKSLALDFLIAGFVARECLMNLNTCSKL